MNRQRQSALGAIGNDPRLWTLRRLVRGQWTERAADRRIRFLYLLSLLSLSLGVRTIDTRGTSSQWRMVRPRQREPKANGRNDQCGTKARENMPLCATFLTVWTALRRATNPTFPSVCNRNTPIYIDVAQVQTVPLRAETVDPRQFAPCTLCLCSRGVETRGTRGTRGTTDNEACRWPSAGTQQRLRWFSCRLGIARLSGPPSRKSESTVARDTLKNCHFVPLILRPGDRLKEQ